MKAKKLISILCAVAMMTTFASCGTKSETEESDGVKTLTWLVPGDKQSGQDQVMEAVNKITEQEIGAKLDLQFIDAGAFTERMTMKMASSDDYDMCFTGFVNPYAQAAENGGLLELDSLLENYPELKASIPENVWEGSKYKGHIYAVPNMQIQVSTYALQFKKDLVDKYNFDVSSVKHVEDIEPFLEAVKNGETGIYPFRTNYGITPWICADYETINGDIAIKKDDGHKVFMRYDTDEFKQGVYKMYDWFKKGYIRADVASVTDDTQDYNAGKYAVSSTTWKPGAEEITKSTLGYDVVYATLNEPYMGIGTGTGTMIGINKKCKDPDLAMKFIQLINTNKELYNLICFGIEGVNYNLTADGKVQYIDGSGYAPKADWKFGNQFNALLLEGQDDDLWEQTENYNASAVNSPLLGFSFSTENITNEISQASSVSEEYKVLNCGAKDPDTYFEEFKEKMKVAGKDKLLEDAQRQVDEFWASKQ